MSYGKQHTTFIRHSSHATSAKAERTTNEMDTTRDLKHSYHEFLAADPANASVYYNAWVELCLQEARERLEQLERENRALHFRFAEWERRSQKYSGAGDGWEVAGAI